MDHGIPSFTLFPMTELYPAADKPGDCTPAMASASANISGANWRNHPPAAAAPYEHQRPVEKVSSAEKSRAAAIRTATSYPKTIAVSSSLLPA